MEHRKSTNAWVWVPILGAIGFLAGLLGCAPAVKVLPVVNVWPMGFAPQDSASAHTTCDMRGNPIVIINKKMFADTTIPRWRWKYIMVHEQKHVEQIWALDGGCHEAHARYVSDPNFRLKMELEAYCVEWQAMLKDDVLKEPHVFLRMMMVNIYNLYGEHLTLEEFETKIPCGREDEDST